MKKDAKKMLLIIGLVMFSINAAFAAKGFSAQQDDAYYSLHEQRYDPADEFLSIAETYSALHFSAATLHDDNPDARDAYDVNKGGVFRYGSSVIIEKYKVKVLQEEIKKSIKNKDKKAVKKLRRELVKAKLDLFRDELHFMIDREALRQDYLLTIADYRKELAKDRADLAKAQNKLLKALADEDDDGVQIALNQIAVKKKEIKADKNAITLEQAKLKKEMKFSNSLVK